MSKPKSSKLIDKDKPFDFILIVTVLIMLCLGIIMVLSASSPSSIAEGGDRLFICKNTRCSSYWPD